MRGIGASLRVFEVLDREPVVPYDRGDQVPVLEDVDGKRGGVVRFENVEFEYPSRRGVSVLKGFELEVGVGESIAIV